MNSEGLKKLRFINLCQLQNSASIINDEFKDLRYVNVSVIITFESGVMTNPSVKEYHKTMTSADRLFLHYDCANKDCTGNGFDLTESLRDALNSRMLVEGRMVCKGKEDWKYINSSACSCMTTLVYKIEPIFEK